MSSKEMDLAKTCRTASLNPFPEMFGYVVMSSYAAFSSPQNRPRLQGVPVACACVGVAGAADGLAGPPASLGALMPAIGGGLINVCVGCWVGLDGGGACIRLGLPLALVPWADAVDVLDAFAVTLVDPVLVAWACVAEGVEGGGLIECCVGCVFSGDGWEDDGAWT